MSITLPHAYPQGGGSTTYRGTYSHTLGAAEETFTLGSARVSSIVISNQDSGAKLQNVRFSESVSGSTNTVTVHALDAVTTGRIEVRAFAGN